MSAVRSLVSAARIVQRFAVLVAVARPGWAGAVAVARLLPLVAVVSAVVSAVVPAVMSAVVSAVVSAAVPAVALVVAVALVARLAR